MQLQNSLTGPGICVQEKKHQKAFKKKKKEIGIIYVYRQCIFWPELKYKPEIHMD